MISHITALRALVAQIYRLAKPFGRKKLLVVICLSVLQGFFQVVGVTSIFPFLALAADPDRLRNSNIGNRVLSALPVMDNIQLLFVTGFFAVAMLLISNAVNLTSEVVRIRYTNSYAHWLRIGLIRKIVARPYANFLKVNSTIFLKKVLGDVNTYTSAVLLPLLDMSARVITVILLLITLVLVHPAIALGAGTTLGAVYLTIFWFLAKYRRKASHRILKSTQGMYKEAYQLFGGIKTVKVHGVEESFITRFSKHSSILARIASWTPLFASFPRYLIEPCAFGSLVVAIMIYAGRGHDLAAILPNLAVIAMAAYRMLPSIQLMYAQMSGITTARFALDEISTEIKEIEMEQDLDSGGNGNSCFLQPQRIAWSRAIKIDNLTFKYPNSLNAVIQDFRFVINKNTSLGIIGQTGSGKSTLVDLILGLHMATKGNIYIDNIPLGSENRRAWRAGIGYVPQDIFLIDDSLSANIAFGVKRDEIDHQAVTSAAKAAQIFEFIENELPEGFDTVVGERGVRLSGGQRQRVGLARALYHKPDILILDEATSALDVATEAEVMKAIDLLHGSITLIIIAHRLSTVEGCDSILNMDQINEQKGST